MEVSPNFSDKAKEDYELVLKAQQGDERAFAELLGRYRDSLYFMLLKMVKNKDDAEDLTIEAFGKAFKNINSYSPKYAFSTWLFKIASNNGIDYLRSRKSTRKNVSIDSTHDDSDYYSNISLVSSSPNPEENMITKQKEVLLRSVIKKLHPDYRKIIMLRYFKEYSYNEIAAELELPIGTVKARLHRSRELLASTIRQNKINDLGKI